MEEKITAKALMEEIKVVLSDEFVAEIQPEQEGLTIRFTNGQKFRLSIAEME